MYLTEHFSEETAKQYFGALVKQIKDEDLNEIIFKSSNDFFLNQLNDRNFYTVKVLAMNKPDTSFNYRLKIRQSEDTEWNERLKAKINVLNLKPQKIKEFIAD